MTRRVLWIAYFFPPVGGVSVPRTLGFARLLPDHGWTPTILTPRDAAHHLQDPGGLEAVPPGTPVIRTRIVEPSALKQAAARVLSRTSAKGRSPGAEGGSRPPRDLGRWRRLLFFPDDQLGWVAPALGAGLREVRRRRYDAIFSSSSPVSAHLAAGLIARLTHTPWIAEFRDPWVGNALAPPLPWFHRMLARRLERWIVSTASASVFVTEGLADMYRQRYPHRAESFATVTNAYDLVGAPLVRPARDRARPAGTTRMVYAGTLDRPAELRVFLDGLRAWYRRGRTAKLRVDFIGHAHPDCLRLLSDAHDVAGPGSVTWTGFLPRDEARGRIAGADAALILLGDGASMGLFVGGKLFEYLAADVPILAMVPDGDARRILESLEWGVIARPQPTSVADAIDRLIDTPPTRQIADPGRRFERSAIVARMASVLESVGRR